MTPLAHYLEYLDLAGAVLADPPPVLDGTVTARGPGLSHGLGRGGGGPVSGVSVRVSAAASMDPYRRQTVQ